MLILNENKLLNKFFKVFQIDSNFPGLFTKINYSVCVSKRVPLFNNINCISLPNLKIKQEIFNYSNFSYLKSIVLDLVNDMEISLTSKALKTIEILEGFHLSVLYPPNI